MDVNSPATRRPLLAALPKRGAAVLLVASLAGCQALGGGGGVMPVSEVGPPPSMRSALPAREARNGTVDSDGQPLQTAPTRRLDLPKTARGEARSAETASRRISRDDLEGGNDPRSASGSGGMQPSMSANGGVGVGGKF